MGFEVKIVGVKRNELLKRNDVFFEITHDRGPTPPRIKVREKLANLLQVDVDRVYIVKFETETGTVTARGEAHVYDTPEQARIIEPKHIIMRNTGQKEERK